MKDEHPWRKPYEPLLALRWFFQLVGWSLSKLAFLPLFVRFQGDRRLVERGGVLLVATHRTLLDSFIIAAAILRLRVLLRRPKLVPWNLPEWRNFAFLTPLRLLMRALPNIFVNRDDPRGMVIARQRVIEILKRGENVLLFPSAGRESSRQPLQVTDAMGRLIAEASVVAPVVAIRVDGLPVWDGQRMQGSKLSRTWQFVATVLRQTMFSHLTVTVTALPQLRDLTFLSTRQESDQLAAAFAREAIRPLYPPNPTEATT